MNPKSIIISCILILMTTSVAYAQHDIYLPMINSNNVPGSAANPTSTPVVLVPTSTPIPPTATPSASSSLLPNGDFEQGETVWTFENGAFLTDSPILVRNGIYSALLGGDTDAEERISQRVMVPVNQPFLSYWYTISSDEFSCNYDAAYIWVDPNPDDSEFSAEIVGSHFTFCDDEDHIDWRQNIIDLQAYAGQTLELEFEMDTDSSAASFWRLDDIAFQSTNP